MEVGEPKREPESPSQEEELLSKERKSKRQRKAEKREKNQVVKRDPMENCELAQIALKVSYNGQNYGGFEHQESSSIPCVETIIFEKLHLLRLVNKEAVADYTKAGRTDKGVSAAQNLMSFKIGGSGVVGVIQQAAVETVFAKTFFLADGARKEANNAVYHHRDGQLAAGDHEIAEAILAINKMIDHSLVQSLITRGDKNKVLAARQLHDVFLGQARGRR